MDDETKYSIWMALKDAVKDIDFLYKENLELKSKLAKFSKGISKIRKLPNYAEWTSKELLEMFGENID